MNITIIGAGNIGTYLAVEFAAKGHRVTMHSRSPQRLSMEMEVVYDNGEQVKTAALAGITEELGAAVENADMILITHPAFMIADTAAQLFDVIPEHTAVGLIPGTGGGEFAFQKHIREKQITLFGLQRVPAVARLLEYGKRVHVSGVRDKLFLGAIPQTGAAEYAALFADTFGIPCETLPNYLCVTLTPSNPILHTTRLRTLFSDYQEGKRYPRNPLFYEEWDDPSSECLLACDEELQAVCRALSRLDLTMVRSLRQHYESDTPQALTRKIKSIQSFRGLLSPMCEVEGGYAVDFHSRYFMADFPYGLAIIKQIADLAKIDVPNITETLEWYHRVTGNKREFSLKDYGIDSIDALYAIYQ